MSPPTRATNVTCAPTRAAATAWLAPLPPAAVVRSPPKTVSPGIGSRSARTIISVLDEPTTMTRAGGMVQPAFSQKRRGTVDRCASRLSLDPSGRAMIACWSCYLVMVVRASGEWPQQPLENPQFARQARARRAARWAALGAHVGCGRQVGHGAAFFARCRGQQSAAPIIDGAT